MLRKTLVSIAVSSALFVSSSYALELGELTSQSNLNEPYRGKIALSDVGNLTNNDILVRLGSENEFRQAGFMATSVLSQLKFNVVRENRDLVVTVSSERPLQVDELRFILAARWPSGQVVREYKTPINRSALVDKSQNEVLQSALASSNQLVEPTASAFRNARATVQRMPIKGQVDVVKGNTLWSIAGKNSPTSQLTIYQTMMAIQALNKDAFYSNNINLLKEGAVLRLPTQEQIALFNQTMSKEEFQRQHEAWMASKGNQNNGAVEQAQLNTQAKAKTPSNQPNISNDKLTLASGQSVLPEDKSSSNTGDDSNALDALQNELSASQEMLDKEQREKGELSNQLNDLNKQLATLEQLISLKDTQMAELQQQFASAQQALQEQKNTVDQLLEADQLRREKEQAEADSLMNKVFGNPIIVSIGAVVLLLFGVLMGILMRRGNKKKEDEAKESSKDEFDLSSSAPVAAVAAGSALANDDQDKELNEEDPFAFDLDDSKDDNDDLDDFGSFDEELATDDLPTTLFDETPADDSDNKEESTTDNDDVDDIFASFDEVDELPEPELQFDEQDDEFEAAVDDEDVPTVTPEPISSETVEPEAGGEVESEEQSAAESEEESFVSSLLNDVDQEDSDEADIFSGSPDDSLANSIEESLADAQQADEIDEAPSFGESEAAEDEEESDEEEDFDFFDASGDEAATKLDLARAYLDMGDEEGARVILEDVAESGNEQQIAEATNMMERMFPSD